MHIVLLIHILLILFITSNSAPNFTLTDLNKTLISVESLTLSFKYLQSDHNLIYIGTWDNLFAVPIQNVSILQSIIYWPESCLPIKVNCGNYIKIMAKLHDALILCGTYGENPKCQKFTQVGHTWNKSGNLLNGESIVTSSAQSLWSGVHLYKDVPYQRLYTATYVKNNIPVLRAKNFTEETMFISEKNPKMFFHEPVFKAMLAFNEKVYLFFNEESLENENFLSVTSLKKKQSIARVGRVCLNDLGFRTWDLPDNEKYFTSFFKTQLLCSIEGKQLSDVIIFNKIVAVSSLGPGDLLYVLMAYDSPLIRLSAVCAYRMSDVEHAFSTGRQLSLKQNSGEGKPPYWIKVDEATLHENNIYDNATGCNVERNPIAAEFILSNPLLSNPVRPIGDRPLVLMGGLSTSQHATFFTGSEFHYQIPYHVHGSLASALNVLFDVQASDDSHHDVLLLGTENGAVIKIALPSIPKLSSFAPPNAPAAAGASAAAADGFGKLPWTSIKLPQPILVETVQLLKPGRLVHTLEANKRHNRIMAIHPQQLASLPLARCEFYDNCAKCVALRDPFCSWHVEFRRCIQWIDFGISNMSSGIHAECGEHVKVDRTTKTSLLSPSRTTAPRTNMELELRISRLPNPMRARATKLLTTTSVKKLATERPSQNAVSINLSVSEAILFSKGEFNNHISMGFFLGVLVSLLVLTFFVAFFVGYICARRIYRKKQQVMLMPKTNILNNSAVVLAAETKDDFKSSFEYHSCTLKERSQSEASHCVRVGDVLSSPRLTQNTSNGSRPDSLAGLSRQLARPNDYETSNKIAVFPSISKMAPKEMNIKPQPLVVSLSATPYNTDKLLNSSSPLSQFAQNPRLHKPYKTSVEQTVLPILQPQFASHFVSPIVFPTSASMPAQLEMELDSPTDPLRFGLQYVDADSTEEEEPQLVVAENELAAHASYFIKHSFNKRVAAVPMLDKVGQIGDFCDVSAAMKHHCQRPDSANLDAYLDISPDIGFNLSNCSSFSNMSNMQD